MCNPIPRYSKFTFTEQERNYYKMQAVKLVDEVATEFASDNLSSLIVVLPDFVSDLRMLAW